MIRFAAAALTLLLLPATPPSAAPPAPPAPAAQPAGPLIVRVRILKASRKGPAKLDPSLAPLKQQLSKLAYVRWDQVSGRDFPMTVGKIEFTTLPYGDNVALTVLEASDKYVTVEVALAQRNTQSRLTIEKGQRIVHQVSGEKDGVAYFVTVHVDPQGP